MRGGEQVAGRHCFFIFYLFTVILLAICLLINWKVFKGRKGFCVDLLIPRMSRRLRLHIEALDGLAELNSCQMVLQTPGQKKTVDCLHAYR